MSSKSPYNHKLLFGFFFLVLVSACSLEKDSFLNRTYHNTTSHYNGYFNSREGMREALYQAGDKKEEDYDEILPLFLDLNEEETQQLLPAMETCIEKSSIVIDRHKMDIPKRDAKKRKRPILNKWIDENYIIIGKANYYKGNFYKAEEFFRFVLKNYDDAAIKASASTWLARTYMKQGNQRKANSTLLEMDKLRDAPDELQAELLLTKADYELFLGNQEMAIRHIEDALPFIKKKKDRARPTFILAQLKQANGKAGEAVELYAEVVRLKPKYEMEFYARINQALAFSRNGGNSVAIKEMLDKMLKDDKNIEYRDQILFALADIELEERNREGAIDLLVQSIEANTDNQKQRAKSYLRLADIYFEDKAYVYAQAYYDSTQGYLDPEHERMDDIKNKAESLTELVGYLNTIATQDSLLQFSMMSEEDRIAAVTQIRDLDIQAAERRLAAEKAAAAAGEEADLSGSGPFWVYNGSLKASGYNNFKDRWGDRPLEDNWRRSVKFGGVSAATEEEEVVITQEDVDPESLVPSLEEYMSNIPLSDEDIAKSTESVSEAYYYAGVIYKERLDDFDNGIESFEVLVENYEVSSYHPMSLYQLYRSYYNKEQEGYKNPLCSTCNSSYWKSLVLERYPASEYAELVKNPNFQAIEDLRQAEEADAYTNTLSQYYDRQYETVLGATEAVIAANPENHLIPKYYLLRALAVAEIDKFYGSFDRAIDFLEQTVQAFPGTEEAERAQEILDGYGATSAKPRDEPSGEGESEENGGSAEAGSAEDILANSPFTCNQDQEHWFGISFPKGSSPMNEVKQTMSDYNKVYYKNDSYTVAGNPIGDTYLVLVKKFPSADEAMKYYKGFNTDLTELESVKGDDFTSFVIDKKNFITLFKNKNVDEFKLFFDACYKSE